VKHADRVGVAAILAICLAGCASTSQVTTRPAPTDPQSKAQPPRSSNINLSGFSVGFRQGYTDGCASGREGERHRNETRYKGELDYTMGWNDGYSVCRR
jgi:hypothetical protein